MKLWSLRAREDLPDDDNPWNPWYDKTFEFVIRAETEEQARQIATENAADEIKEWSGAPDAWLNAKYSTCEVLQADGNSGMIVENHLRA